MRDSLHTENYVQPAASKFTTIRPSDADTLTTEVQMSDSDFDDGLTRAVKNVQQKTDVEPTAVSKLPTNPVVDTNTRSKRVKFATKRYIQRF